jgi:hypothetical protein
LKLYKDPVRTRLIVETDAVTSIADRDGDNVVINIYPNPANQKVHLHGPGFQEFEYAILDARGSTVMTGRTRGRTLDVGRLPAGSYLVKLRNPSGILHHRKLVVRH